MTDPARLEGEAKEQVLARLTEGEVVEILFDVIAWSQQKVLVSLALDAPVDPDAFTSLDFDADGHAVVGGPAR